MKRLSEASALLASLRDIGFDTVRVPEPDQAPAAVSPPELSADASERAERLLMNPGFLYAFTARKRLSVMLPRA